MKRFAVLFIAALMLFLTACGGGNNNSNSGGNTAAGSNSGSNNAGKSEEVVTIRTSITAGELSEEQIAEFEAAHPNINVEIEELDDTKLAAQLATNSAPDIIRINGVFDLPSYVIRGIAMDLTEYIENSELIDMEDLHPIVDVYRFDGKTVGEGPIYGLPKDWSNDFAIFYNKRAFDRAGVEVPDPSEPLTWPEVMELAKKLTIVGEDGKVVQYGLAANEWGRTEPNFNNMMQYLLSAGVNISNEDFTEINVDNQAVRDYLAMWVDAVKSNVGPNLLNNDQTSGGDLFLSDRAAMIINGYWYSGVIRGNADAQTHLEDFGMLPTPIAPGGERVAPSGSATGAIINKNTKHPEEAWTFFEWFFAGKPAEDRASTGWGLPIFNSLMEKLPQETEFDKQVYNVLQDELQYTDYLGVNPYLSDAGWGIFEKYAQQLYFDEITIDEAIEGMNKDLNVAVTEAYNAINQ